MMFMCMGMNQDMISTDILMQIMAKLSRRMLKLTKYKDEVVLHDDHDLDASSEKLGLPSNAFVKM